MHNFLRQAMSARKGIDLSVLEVRLALMEWMSRLEMDPAFAERYLNEGFSGGEKKRNEILQMALLEPEVAILDETDSGLDVDALRVVARGVQEVRKDRAEHGRAGHHALPTPARRAHAGSGAHPDRRPGRRLRWPRAGDRARSTGVRSMAAMTNDPRTDPRTAPTADPRAAADGTAAPLDVTPHQGGLPAGGRSASNAATPSSSSTRRRPRRSRARCSTR